MGTWWEGRKGCSVDAVHAYVSCQSLPSHANNLGILLLDLLSQVSPVVLTVRIASLSAVDMKTTLILDMHCELEFRVTFVRLLLIGFLLSVLTLDLV